MSLQKEDLLAALNSVTSIPVVPFRGGQIDYDAHAKNINYLMENNHLDGDRPRVIGIAGTSLIHHISADEQVRLLGFTGEQMGGRGVLMSGLAPNPVGDAERLIEREAAARISPGCLSRHAAYGRGQSRGHFRVLRGFCRAVGAFVRGQVALLPAEPSRARNSRAADERVRALRGAEDRHYG